jgi:hypothetical protein
MQVDSICFFVSSMFEDKGTMLYFSPVLRTSSNYQHPQNTFQSRPPLKVTPVRPRIPRPCPNQSHNSALSRHNVVSRMRFGMRFRKNDTQEQGRHFGVLIALAALFK